MLKIWVYLHIGLERMVLYFYEWINARVMFLSILVIRGPIVWADTLVCSVSWTCVLLCRLLGLQIAVFETFALGTTGWKMTIVWLHQYILSIVPYIISHTIKPYIWRISYKKGGKKIKHFPSLECNHRSIQY